MGSSFPRQQPMESQGGLALLLKNTQHLNILHNISKGTGHSSMLFLCFYNEVKIEKILIFK